MDAYEWVETVVDALDDFAGHQMAELLAAAGEADPRGRGHIEDLSESVEIT